VHSAGGRPWELDRVTRILVVGGGYVGLDTALRRQRRQFSGAG
jgi:NADH dehydrogenase FAD-containing subunit